MSGFARRIVLSGLLGVGAFVLGGAGCIIEIDTPDGGGDGGGGDGPSTIRVRVINASDTTLDPQIFYSASDVSNEDLFVSANKFTRFGVGTLGLLGPASQDSFTVNCADFALIGTAGGAFGDDLQNPDGNGQAIVLEKNRSVFCGSELTITYRQSGGGFSTTFDVE